MTFRLVSMAVALSLVTSASSKDEGLPEPLRSMVAAERAFSRYSEEHGMKPAFLEYLGDDAIVFTPRATGGRRWYTEQPEEPEPRATLTWRPVFADIAASGDFGYTTGPYRLDFVREGEPRVSHGHYVTVWRKTSEDRWKVAIDKGIRHPEPSTAPDEVHYPEGTKRAAAPARLEDLLARDRGLGELGVEEVASELLRVYRDGAFPLVGKKSARGLVENAKLSYSPEGGKVAASADLAFTYGTALGKSGETSAYLHIWKREGGEWRLVLDNRTELP